MAIDYRNVRRTRGRRRMREERRPGRAIRVVEKGEVTRRAIHSKNKSLRADAYLRHVFKEDKGR